MLEVGVSHADGGARAAADEAQRIQTLLIDRRCETKERRDAGCDVRPPSIVAISDGKDHFTHAALTVLQASTFVIPAGCSGSVYIQTGP